MVVVGGPSYGSASGSVWLDHFPREAYIDTNIDWYIDTGTRDYYLQNPGGYKTVWSIQIKNPNDSSYTTKAQRTFWEGSGTKTINFTQEEQNNMYAFLNTRNYDSYRIVVDTYNGDTYMGTRMQYGTIYVGAANPVFSNFEYEDVNQDTIALTGNNQKIIKGQSTIKTLITLENKATPVKQATINKYRTTIGNKQSEVNYSSSSAVEMVIDHVDNSEIKVYAIDSRNNSTVATKRISIENYIDYTNINIKSAIVERDDGGIGTGVNLTFEGEIFEVNFGNVSNSIKTCSYKYRTAGSSEDYVEGLTNIKPTNISEGRYSNSVDIQGDLGANGFDNSKSFEIVITISDEISSYQSVVLLGAGTPLVAHHRNGVSFGALYDENLGGLLQFGGSKACPSDSISALISRHTISGGSWNPSEFGKMVQERKVGNKLTIENGRIKVGKGVTEVIASATMTAFNSNSCNGDFEFQLSVNNGKEFYPVSTQYFNGVNIGWRPRMYYTNYNWSKRRR